MSRHDVPFVGSHLQHAHMHLSHFAAHNLFISLSQPPRRFFLPLLSLSQLLAPKPLWQKCMSMLMPLPLPLPLLLVMLMLILHRVSSNRVVDVPLRQPFGGFCRYHPRSFPRCAALSCLPASQLPNSLLPASQLPSFPADVVLMFALLSVRQQPKTDWLH